MRRRAVLGSKVIDRFSGVVVSPSRKIGVPLPGMQQWYDCADTSTVILSGTNVTAWNDKSGNAYHLDAYSSDPVYGGGGARSINGIVCIEWTPDAARPLHTSSINQNDDTRTDYIVALLDDVSNDRALISAYNEPNLALWTRNISSAGRLCSVQTGQTPTTLASQDAVSLSTATPYVFGMRMAGASDEVTLSINGSRETDGSWTPGGFGNEMYFRIGHGHHYRDHARFDGLVGECLVYNAVHTDSEMTAVEQYLMRKWGIA